MYFQVLVFLSSSPCDNLCNCGHGVMHFASPCSTSLHVLVLILMPSGRLATNCASLWFILTLYDGIVVHHCASLWLILPLSGGFSGQLNYVDNSKAKLCVCKETTACKLILMPSMQPSIPICRESTAAELYFGPIHC